MLINKKTPSSAGFAICPVFMVAVSVIWMGTGNRCVLHLQVGWTKLAELGDGMPVLWSWEVWDQPALTRWFITGMNDGQSTAKRKKQKMKSAVQMHNVEVELLAAMMWELQSDGLWSGWSEGWGSSAPMREEDALSSSYFRVRRMEAAHLSPTHTRLQPRY